MKREDYNQGWLDGVRDFILNGLNGLGRDDYDYTLKELIKELEEILRRRESRGY